MKSSPSLALRLRTALEEAIISGEYAPGSALVDQDLAKRFGTSRTPVREALLGLAADGLVQMVPRSGTFVAKPSAKDVLGVIECLGFLEAASARLAARRMSADQRGALKQIRDHGHAFVTGDAPQVETRARYEELNATFHEAIYSGSANAILAQGIRSMRRRAAVWGRSFFESDRRIRESIGEHAAIADAIIAGNEDEAQRLMMVHISTGGNFMFDLLLRLDEA